jgi:hypothetical protein
MDKMAGLEASFNTKLDTRFQEVLACLPPLPQPGIPVPHARRVPLIPPSAGTVVRGENGTDYFRPTEGLRKAKRDSVG